ncbi:hypothetical protein LSH36_3g29035 [Paralvinella palmiformis]|uniref:Large ribosomal subunit protein uL22m n=1 Tax=Paralvinella palmiformis TaxID=53620 RepID=A0AAD9KFV6_9ANNE|nr:hypothetical protein LSH36_3g29035 [Paralvinella palmiformis]
MSLLSLGVKTFLTIPEIVARSFSGVLSTLGQCQSIHTVSALNGKHNTYPSEPKAWPKYNDIIYPPQKEGEPPRPAEITHYRANVKCSQKKLWYVACMIRGMSIDEALKQLSFYKRKGAEIVKETLLEAQEIAVRDHNVEYKSNLWIADSTIGRARIVRGHRIRARNLPGTIHYRFSHYFVRLREGRPPEHYYPRPMTGNEKMADYLKSLRERRVYHSL